MPEQSEAMKILSLGTIKGSPRCNPFEKVNTTKKLLCKIRRLDLDSTVLTGKLNRVLTPLMYAFRTCPDAPCP